MAADLEALSGNQVVAARLDDGLSMVEKDAAMAVILVLALQEQHALLSLLCERSRSASTNEERQQDFGQFSKALIAHLAFLDSVLLPAVVGQAQADISSALTEGSSDLRRMLADAIAAPDIPAFAGAMLGLADRLQEHLGIEAALLCPHLAAFSESEQFLIASELELEAERLVRTHSKPDRGSDR